MNLHYQIIRITPAHLFLLSLLLLSFCASSNVGKTVVAHRKNIICIDQERDALLKFKNQLDNDGCELMTLMYSWGNPNTPDCCTWDGVSCSTQSGRVIGLDLSGDRYEQDCLYTHFYSGRTIPIPNELGNLTSLESLDLSNNYWRFANNLNWLSRLTSLRILNLSGTDLSMAKGWFLVIKSLPLLEVLMMDYCKLPTPLSSSTFLQSANLRIISLSGNNFSCSSSSFQCLFDTSNYSFIREPLEHLIMSDCNLQGPIPDAIGKLESLTYLDLSENSLSSTIPNAIGKLESLTYLDLSRNSLSSTIPDAITNLQSLTHMDLSYNSLSGPIPSTLRTMHSLSYLDLSNNRLEGSIPSAIGDSHSLIEIDLSNNHLQGPIPSSIANLEYLNYLELSTNNLSGDIPCKLGIKNFMLYADFSNNNLSGSIPKYLSDLRPDYFQGNPSFRTDKIRGRCDKINVGLYVSIGLGFYTGFWAFCGTLTLKNSWRRAYFRFVDHIFDNIYVIVVVNFARLRRHFQV